MLLAQTYAHFIKYLNSNYYNTFFLTNKVYV